MGLFLQASATLALLVCLLPGSFTDINVYDYTGDTGPVDVTAGSPSVWGRLRPPFSSHGERSGLISGNPFQSIFDRLLGNTFVGPFLKKLGGGDIFTGLRVLARDLLEINQIGIKEFLKRKLAKGEDITAYVEAAQFVFDLVKGKKQKYPKHF